MVVGVGSMIRLSDHRNCSGSAKETSEVNFLSWLRRGQSEPLSVSRRTSDKSLREPGLKLGESKSQLLAVAASRPHRRALHVCHCVAIIHAATVRWLRLLRRDMMRIAEMSDLGLKILIS